MRIVLILCYPFFLLLFFSGQGSADIIKFKKGAKKKCVIVKETEDAVYFVNRMGTCKMNRSRIESIEYESDEVNTALQEKWEAKKTQRQTAPEEPEHIEQPPKKQGPKAHRTYTVEPTKLSLNIGGRATAIRSGQLMATFVIKDLGKVEGSKLFHFTVTSYRSGIRNISLGDIYALTARGMRVNPKPLDGYPILRASLSLKKTATGHVPFPTDEQLKWLFVKSDIAEFKLDLDTGEFVSQRGPL
jgi:hypothetical protein